MVSRGTETDANDICRGDCEVKIDFVRTISKSWIGGDMRRSSATQGLGGSL